MKKQILSIVLGSAMLLTGTISHAAEIKSTKTITPQEKIISDFNTQFSSTPEVSLTKDGFIASSVIDGHQVSSAYNKKGNRVYSIVRYSSDNLDKNIVDVVKGSYDKYFITSMEKVQEPGTDAVFIVHLNNAKSVKTVRVSNNGMELIQNFKKI